MKQKSQVRPDRNKRVGEPGPRGQCVSRTPRSVRAIRSPGPFRLHGLAPALLAMALAACVEALPEAPVGTDQTPSAPSMQAVPDSAMAATGQTVYIPTYSHIYIQDGTREFDLAATLSIRNTDPEYGITVSRVSYNNSQGRLVRDYLEAPVYLGPLASRPFVIDETDRSGGVGANFLVQWHAESRVSQPIMEAVMISTTGAQGISFVSRGQVVRPLPADSVSSN